jgi:succinoglycan biosynthesis transport protein ExoP
MALSPVTPRDRLQNIGDLARKAAKYWWLVAIFAVAGAGISLAFAMSRPRAYNSWSTLFYQERIQSSLLQNREDTAQRNIGDRYRELLLSRKQLLELIADPKLAFPKAPDEDLAVERLRTALRFDSRGANAFRISYTDADPERARAVVDKLTKALQDKDESLRNELATATVNFAVTQRDEATIELKKREQAYSEFLAKHPEFIADANQGSEGASIRAANKKPVPGGGGNSQLQALDRQRDRIMARLNAAPDAPPVRMTSPSTPEKVAAEAAVNDAQREVSSAQREYDDLSKRYTENFPTVKSAKERLDSARVALAHAQANVPPDQEIIIAPATAEDREKLKKQLVQIEAQMNQIQANSGKTTPAIVDTTTKGVVELETQYADLRRAQNESRERMQSLADSVFRAQIDANQKAAEAGGRLSVVDPAFTPMRPTGTGKTIFLMAGMVLFLGLGLGISIGLAIIDDRLYRRSDIDALGIPVLAVIPKAIGKQYRNKRKGTIS